MDALLALVRQRGGGGLELNSYGWRFLRHNGLTRGEAQRALDDLLGEGVITVVVEHGVMVVRPAGEGDAA